MRNTTQYVHAFTEDAEGLPVNHRLIGEYANAYDAGDAAEAHAINHGEVCTVTSARDGRVHLRVNPDGTLVYRS